MEERRFPRAVGSLDELFQFVDSFAGRNAVGTDAAFDLRLAIEELFTNMVKYHPEGGEQILLRLERDGPRVIVTLQDYGVDAWDVTRAPAAEEGGPAGALAPGGRGLHLVRKVTDSLRYEHANRVSTITFSKQVEA